MVSSREESPDWLRSFQAPTHSPDSEHSPNTSPSSQDSIDHHDILRNQSDEESPGKIFKTEDHKPTTKKKMYSRKLKQGTRGRGAKKISEELASEKHHALGHTVWKVSSDSESCPDENLMVEDHLQHEVLPEHERSQIQEKRKSAHATIISIGGETPYENTLKERSLKRGPKVEGKPLKGNPTNNNVERKGTDGSIEAAEEGASDKHTEPCISPSRLPLVISDKVHRSKTLVECEGESIDLSGDMGAVGRIVISDSPSENHEMYLDLKGTIYKTTIVPSRTFCVVSFGQSEAKIEAIMNDFIQLKPQSNVYEAETMVEGTLDGFSFDSEDEAEKLPKAMSHQTDQHEGAEEQTNGKTKGKTEKTSGAAVRKKGKTGGGKARPQKKAGKKAQVSKRAKPKK